ncbi:MAG: hypothetical protein ABEJ83_01670 [Candidatus Nanohaloarchaea archaeon]
MADFSLKEHDTVIIEDVPYNWVPTMKFFYSDVPGFPLHRIHFKEEGERYFGVPLTKKVIDRKGNGYCDIEVKVLVNKEIEEVEDQFKQELRERLGVAESLSKDDIIDCCNCSEEECDCEKHENWEKIVELIFDRLKKYYGPELRCGQFYSPIYGIFRLVSTWNVPGGRKQELIMSSNVMKTAGEEVETPENMQINLRMLPTYKEIRNGELEDFENFQEVAEAINEFGDKHLTHEEAIGDQKFYTLDNEKEVPGSSNGRQHWNTLVDPLEESSKNLIVQLKEDMNRMFQRPFVMITYLYNLMEGFDFSEVDQDAYANLYRKGLTSDARGTYPKVMGMILQQAFANYDVIPVDTWVETFFTTLLDTDKKQIPDSGYELGKFERFVWETAQLRKTNQPEFDSIVHCIKTGILNAKSMKMREPNPLSCHLCDLSENSCPSYERIKDGKVKVIERDELSTEEYENSVIFHTRKKKVDDYESDLYLRKNYFDLGELQRIDFMILKHEDGSKHVFTPGRKDKTKWNRTDDMSTFTVDLDLEEGRYTVDEIAGEESRI